MGTDAGIGPGWARKAREALPRPAARSQGAPSAIGGWGAPCGPPPALGLPSWPSRIRLIGVVADQKLCARQRAGRRLLYCQLGG